ncbi:MAG: insulinase family protein [Aestuariivirga sp.]|uniref:M16 family metallopeptidase n=1 Tax=Aestuariivirga sp. TaxID=2650926 RepID=UPI0025BF9947|nr:pitrilysin family protein [Aestuariivirga sp.]MCA3560797.1 insulinase family protein [Aestuariivirga sp.]
MSVEITRLPNGIHVVTHHMPHLETAALGIWVKAGARDERAEENGIAHFLEHMAFKGTPRRSARAIAEEIESAGGEINAATGMETTTYYARVLKQDWALALDILADIFTAPALDEEELERERDVILQEIAAAHDQPDDLVFDLAQAASFGGHPLARSILGTEELIGGVSRQQILDWRNRNYWGARIVVAAAGHIDHKAFAAEAARLLGAIAEGSEPKRETPSFLPTCCTAEKPLDQAHIVLSFEAPGYRHPDIYVLQVLSNILGGGMSSRLFQEVREKRGLCYSVFSFGSAYEDAGQVGVYAATSPEHSNELLGLTSEVMLSVAREVTEAEVARAKAQLKASLVINLESASGRADQIARQFLAFGEVPAISTLTAKIEAVTPEQVRALAERLFRHQKPAFSAVGHIVDMAVYDKIARQFA